LDSSGGRARCYRRSCDRRGAAVATSVLALVLGELDRRNARRIAAADRRFQRLARENELLQRLLENYNRGGSSDPAESQRMGSEALTLIGSIGEDRLPGFWESHVSSDEVLTALLDDETMPDWKKDAIRVQLALNASRRELLQTL
jgi:hypothetical protein